MDLFIIMMWICLIGLIILGPVAAALFIYWLLFGKEGRPKWKGKPIKDRALDILPYIFGLVPILVHIIAYYTWSDNARAPAFGNLIMYLDFWPWLIFVIIAWLATYSFSETEERRVHTFFCVFKRACMLAVFYHLALVQSVAVA